MQLNNITECFKSILQYFPSTLSYIPYVFNTFVLSILSGRSRQVLLYKAGRPITLRMSGQNIMKESLGYGTMETCKPFMLNIVVRYYHCCLVLELSIYTYYPTNIS